MDVLNLRNRTAGSQYVAIELLKQMKHIPDSVLGLATGNTMVEVYEHLADLININQIDVSKVRTFNLDEYIGLSAEHHQSYHVYMNERLFDHNIGWNKDQIHLPAGDAPNVEQECLNYEQLLNEVGPADIQILGIGENGHIGFNEPGSSFESVTRVVDLTPSTINANSHYFDNVNDVPKQAISMGLASIMRAKRIILFAFGSNKKEAVQQMLNGDITESLPASILQRHPNVEVVLDDEIYKFSH